MVCPSQNSPVTIRLRRTPDCAAWFLPKALQRNWFDQLGVKRDLQQFHLDGKKSCKAAPAYDYFFD
jgi:hypothetical protein